MRTRATLTVLVATLVAWGALLSPTSFSGATFTARTSNTATVQAAPDWTPPTVTLTHPGSPVKDTVTLTATATDGETGVKDVVVQLYTAAGGWTTLCTHTAAPYSCRWDTRTVADGSYSLRAVATDNAGYSTVSAPVTTSVINTFAVVLGDPGDVVRGAVPLSTTLHNQGTSTYTVRVEYAPAGSGTWKSLCTNLASPYTCTWTTTGYANGDYDLRSVAVSGSTTVSSVVVADVLVDNLAPSVTMTDPGSPLSGTRTFAATATDAHSGVAEVVVQYAATGTSTWRTLCTVTAEPWSCRASTAALPDGSYAFRAVATDVAGNTATSAAVTNRVVDNTVSSVSLEDPGAFLTGTVSLVANASSTAGVGSVRIQRAVSGTTTWVDVCTVTAAPYSCPWDTTSVADGLYDLRAVLVDGTGATSTSAVVASRRVDNTPLRGYDAQTVNGAATVGRLENGDVVTLTYTDLIDTTTVTSGWNGGSLAVILRLRDGGVLGLTGKNDTFDVLRSGAAVNIGSVNLKEDYVKGGKTATFNATITASTTTVNGAQVSVVTIRVGALASGGGVRTAANPSTTAWTPSSAVRDLYGVSSSAAPVSELGALDREF